MSGSPYSPAAFVRQVQPLLLRQYFEQASVLELFKLEWPTILHPDPASIATEIASLPEGPRATVEGDFRRVHELSCKDGRLALIERAQAAGASELVAIAGDASQHDLAMAAFLDWRPVFDAASDCAAIDRTASWEWRTVAAGHSWPDLEQAKALLAKEVQAVYLKTGRGRHCEVAAYVRHDPLRVCFCAFPEDFASAELGYHEGRLATQHRRPATEASWVYHPETGRLNVHALGTRELKRQLVHAFGKALLGVERIDDTDPRPPVRLEQLKDPDFRFELDPNGPIDGVDLVEVKMQAPPPIDSQIRFSKPRGSRRDTCLRTSIAQTLESCPAPLSSVEVISAKFRFLVRYGSEPKARSVTCELAMPRRCSLGDGPVDRVIGDTLSRWGLYAEG